jgi:hypothetical protein
MSSSRLSSSMENPKPSMERLVDFYDPVTKGADVLGRTLDQILSWSDKQLEMTHDYIQKLFPLPELSGATAVSAPILDEQTVLLFRQSRQLQTNVLRALKCMLSFYGFDAVDKGWGDHENTLLTITPKNNPQPGFAHWVKKTNHNHRRITRIIRCLRLLGLGGAATDFFNAVIAVQTQRNVISQTSIDYWTAAHTWELRYPMDGQTEIVWLRGF